MVRSKIFNECVYLETKKINPRDAKTELQLYKLKILNCDNVYITVGTANKKNRSTCFTKEQKEKMAIDGGVNDINNNIVYHIIYLMDGRENDVAISRIGIYEVLETKYNSFIDADGDLILDHLTPLLFKYVTSEFIEKNNYYCKLAVPTVDDINTQLVAESKVMDEIITLNDEAENGGVGDDVGDNGDDNDDIIIIDDSDKMLTIYPKQTLEQYYDEYTKSYLSKPMEGDDQSIQWVRAYLMNPHFRIIDKGGAGDCLFYSLASAINDYSINNKSNSVPVFAKQDVHSLREVMSNSITENDFDNYITIYRDLNNRKAEITREIKHYIKEHKRITDNFNETTNDQRRKELINENKEVKKTVKQLENELTQTKKMLNEFKYMKSLRSLRDFKSFVLTSQFWGDEMAIGLLQKHFNFKAIVLSQENFISNVEKTSLPLSEKYVKNMNNIIQCGSSSLGGRENPYFYIILNFTGNHYQVVTYRKKEAFTFNEIPFSLKLAIIKGCMKQDLVSGYGKIENFAEFRDEHIELMFS